MKKYIHIILMASLAMVSFISCNDVVLNEKIQGTGYLNINLQKDDSVLSKAIVSPSEDMTFKVMVYSGENVVASVDDHRSVTQTNPIELPVGSYKVVASYGDNSRAGFGLPCYSGETEILVKAHETVEAELVCTLSNVMVTVDFAENMLAGFTSYSVTVDDGAGNDVTFSKASDNLDEVAHLPATGTLKMSLSLTNVEGKTYNASRVYSGVKARDHYRFHFEMAQSAENNGYGAIRIVVDDTMIDQTLDLELDFSDSEEPSMVTNPEFNTSGEQTFVIGDATPKIMSFDVPEGIESVRLAIDDEVATRASESLAVYELVGASSDVINMLNAKGIKVSSIEKGATSATIEITDYIKSLLTGEYVFELSVYDAKSHVARCRLDFIVMADVDADIVSVAPWAKFAIVTGKYFSSNPPEGLTFMYKKASESSWTTFPAASVKVNGSARTYEAEIGGLDASSKYVVKAVSAADTDTREVVFETEAAGQLYNMSFDDWYVDGKVYYPYAQGSDPTVWDSANKATASLKGSSTVYEESHVVSGKAAKMESKYIVIAFAAGNLYTGAFGKIEGTSGASLDWGADFSCRPVALRGHYDYSPVAINRVKSPYENMKGTMDKCQIMVLLTDWDEQFPINTQEGHFVDVANDPHIIASVKYESDINTGGYQEFVLPLEYRDLTRTPKYVVIVACSSYLGDYFTGGEGSTLYVDEFSFEYDITKLTDEQKAKVNYR